MSRPGHCGTCNRDMGNVTGGICTTCRRRRHRANNPTPTHTRTLAILEDTAFLAATGAGLTEAARRTNTTPRALERLLFRQQLHDLLALLKAHDELPDTYLTGGRIDDRSNITPRRADRGGAWKVA